MALGGVTGNVIDLLWRRGVVDFIAIGSWTICNIADLAIVNFGTHRTTVPSWCRPVWPILFTWRSIVLHSYHVMIYAALLLAVFLTVHFAQANGLNADRTALAVLLLFIPGFAGARLMYVARHWQHFQRDPARIVRRSEAGCRCPAACSICSPARFPCCGRLACRSVRSSIHWRSVLGGVAVAKGGCLLNGCCYGHTTGLVQPGLPDDRGV